MASVWKKTMVYLGLVDDDEDYEYGYDQAPPGPCGSGGGYVDQSSPSVRPIPRDEPSAVTPVRAQTGTATIPLPGGPSTAPQPSAGGTVVRTLAAPPPQPPRVSVIEPQGFNDAQEVGDRIKSGQPVILNLQGLDRGLQRRLVDFASGLTYALNGQMRRAADQVFLLTPSDVDVSQEDKERLRGRGLYDEA